MAKKSDKPIPEGMNNITPYLWFKGDCREAMEYYKLVFGAEAECRPQLDSAGEKVMSAMLKIGNSAIMLCSLDDPDQPKAGVSSEGHSDFWIYVTDSAHVMERALDNGAKILIPLKELFYGDMMGKIRDPFGHTWSIASHVYDYTPEEMMENRKGGMKSRNVKEF